MSVDINTLQSLGLTGTASTGAATKSTEMGQDMFLKLMMTQLQNQNPLKPQDSSEFLSQLAQFSMVTGIQDLQKNFSSFATSMNQDQAVQAANLVGKKALVGADTVALGTSGSVVGQVQLPGDATKVSVSFVAANGVAKRTLELGPQSQGSVPFTWDGLTDDQLHAADPGTYTIKVEAVVGGETVALSPSVEGSIESVTLGGTNGLELDMGALGRHGLKDIQEVR
jgi:flagellar basal-body rod modification protein FlgD